MEYIGFFYNVLFAVVGLFGALLFTWWWVTVGRSSDVYAYITFFMYGVVVTQAVSLYARHKIWDNHIHAGDIINTWWFTLRTFPEFIAIGAIVVTMTLRTILIIRNSRKPKKKKIDRRALVRDFPHPGDNPFIEEPRDPRFP